MIQTREPTPKYTLLDPVSLLWTWNFNMAYMPQIFHSLINYILMVFTSCGKWLS